MLSFRQQPGLLLSTLFLVVFWLGLGSIANCQLNRDAASQVVLNISNGRGFLILFLFVCFLVLLFSPISALF